MEGAGVEGMRLAHLHSRHDLVDLRPATCQVQQPCPNMCECGT